MRVSDKDIFLQRGHVPILLGGLGGVNEKLCPGSRILRGDAGARKLPSRSRIEAPIDTRPSPVKLAFQHARRGTRK